MLCTVVLITFVCLWTHDNDDHDDNDEDLITMIYSSTTALETAISETSNNGIGIRFSLYLHKRL